MLTSTLSCKEDTPELPGTWESGCETFTNTSAGYRFSDCCGMVDFPAFQLAPGVALIQQGAYLNKDNISSLVSVKINIAKDAQTVYLTVDDTEGQSTYTLEKDYAGPLCNCTCP